MLKQKKISVDPLLQAAFLAPQWCEWFGGGQYGMGVEFTKQMRGQSTVVDYKDVPLIEFSECMRDVYAAASGAARKDTDGADKKESEKATAKLKKYVESSKLTNVRCEGTSFMFDGQLGTCTVDVTVQKVRMSPNQ